MGAVDIYHIKWIDSCSQAGWQYFEDIESSDPLECESVGFIVERKEDSVTVCLSLTENACGHTMTIPKSCVTKMTKLGVSHRKF
jgi:hypothetical protein